MSIDVCVEMCVYVHNVQRVYCLCRIINVIIDKHLYAQHLWKELRAESVLNLLSKACCCRTLSFNFKLALL